MGHTFDFDLENKVIRCRCEGVATDETLKEYYAALSAYGRLHPEYSSICDMTGITFLAFSSRTILELARLPPAIPDPEIPRCIVAGSFAMFSTARMFAFEGSDTRPNLHVVRNEREALAIIGIKKARFKPAEPKVKTARGGRDS